MHHVAASACPLWKGPKTSVLIGCFGGCVYSRASSPMASVFMARKVAQERFKTSGVTFQRISCRNALPQLFLQYQLTE